MSISNRDIKRELTNRLRNADLISISDRGVTTVTEEFNGNNSDVEFILTNAGVKNIRSITVDSVSQDYGTDWDFTENSSGITTVTFTSAPTTGTNNVDIQYDYSSSGDRIYPDYAKATISINKFPRIGFDIISSTTTDLVLSGKLEQTNMVISFVAYGVGTKETEELYDSIRSFLLSIDQDLFYLNYLTPTGEGPMLSFGGTNDKVFQKNVDFRAPLLFEQRS